MRPRSTRWAARSPWVTRWAPPAPSVPPPWCTACAAASRSTAWSPCASAPAWARRASSRHSEPSPSADMKPAPSGAVFIAASPDGSAALFLERGEHGLAGRRAVLGVLQREVHGGLDQADVRAAVEAPPLEVVGVDVAPGLDRRGDRVGQLDLAAGAAAGGLQGLEDAARQDVAPDHGQVAGRVLRLGLLDHGLDPAAAALEAAGGDDAVAGGLLPRHFLHRDHAATGALGQVG